MKKKVFLLIAVFTPLIQFSVFASSLEGNFSFEGKPPQAAVVYFPEDKSVAPANKTIDQVNKEFTKKLVIGPENSELTFKNSDSIEHNIYLSQKGKILYTIGLSAPGTSHSHKISWEEGSVAKVSCKIHAKMSAWIISAKSKYFEIIEFNKDKNKKFSIANIPDKLKKVTVWFPNFEPVEVEIKKGESKEIEIKNGDRRVGTLNLSRK